MEGITSWWCPPSAPLPSPLVLPPWLQLRLSSQCCPLSSGDPSTEELDMGAIGGEARKVGDGNGCSTSDEERKLASGCGASTLYLSYAWNGLSPSFPWLVVAVLDAAGVAIGEVEWS